MQGIAGGPSHCRPALPIWRSRKSCRLGASPWSWRQRPFILLRWPLRARLALAAAGPLSCFWGPALALAATALLPFALRSREGSAAARAARPRNDGMADADHALGIGGDRHRVDAFHAEHGFPAVRLEAMLEQVGRTRAALPAGHFAQHHRHQPAPVARGAGNDIEAAVADEAGLDAVGAVIVGEQRVVRRAAGACPCASRPPPTCWRSSDSRAARPTSAWQDRAPS